MSRTVYFILAALLSLPAYAKLPMPSPEEATKKQAAAEKKVKDEDTAKEALGRVQDRVAQHYRTKHPHAPKPVPVVAPATAAKK